MGSDGARWGRWGQISQDGGFHHTCIAFHAHSSIRIPYVRCAAHIPCVFQAHALISDGKLEAEAEKRVVHLQQSAARRIANAGIANGFTTWQRQWEEEALQKRLLAAAGGRLARPVLAAAVAHWIGDWRTAAHAMLRQAASKSHADHEAVLLDLRAEMKAVLQASRDEAIARLAEAAAELEAERGRAASELRATRLDLESISSEISQEVRGTGSGSPVPEAVALCLRPQPCAGGCSPVLEASALCRRL